MIPAALAFLFVSVVACLRHAASTAHLPPHTASVGLLRFRASGTVWGTAVRVINRTECRLTLLLVSKTRHFSNPTRNERSECRVGYAADARVPACRRHATTPDTHTFLHYSTKSPGESTIPFTATTTASLSIKEKQNSFLPKSLNEAPNV